MALNVSSGLTSVTGSVTAVNSGFSSPSATQTIVNVAAVGSGASQDAYTVTAGKKFYLTGVVNSADAAGAVIVYKSDAATIVTKLTTLINSPKTFTPITPIWVYQATTIVKVTATLNVPYQLVGYEE